jgi:septal ring factor EnvC (AmiA/AmiB activator)
MRNRCLLVAVGLLLVAAPLYAQDNPEMDAAQQALESARGHLQAAAHDYAGHRKEALTLVNKALEQVKLGLAAVGRREQRVEKKTERLDQREKKLENRIQNLEKQQQQLKQD